MFLSWDTNLTVNNCHLTDMQYNTNTSFGNRRSQISC